MGRCPRPVSTDPRFDLSAVIAHVVQIRDMPHLFARGGLRWRHC